MINIIASTIMLATRDRSFSNVHFYWRKIVRHTEDMVFRQLHIWRVCLHYICPLAIVRASLYGSGPARRYLWNDWHIRTHSLEAGQCIHTVWWRRRMQVFSETIDAAEYSSPSDWDVFPSAERKCLRVMPSYEPALIVLDPQKNKLWTLDLWHIILSIPRKRVWSQLTGRMRLLTWNFIAILVSEERTCHSL